MILNWEFISKNGQEMSLSLLVFNLYHKDSSQGITQK